MELFKLDKNQEKIIEAEFLNTFNLEALQKKLLALSEEKDADKIALIKGLTQLFEMAKLTDLFEKISHDALEKETKKRHQTWNDLLLLTHIETLEKIVNGNFSQADFLTLKQFILSSVNNLFDVDFTTSFKKNFAIAIKEIDRKLKEITAAKMDLSESVRKLNMLYDASIETLILNLNKKENTDIIKQSAKEINQFLLATKSILDEMVPVIIAPFYQTKNQGVDLQEEIERMSLQIDELLNAIKKNTNNKNAEKELIHIFETLRAVKREVIPSVIVSCDHAASELAKVHEEISMIMLMRISNMNQEKNKLVTTLEDNLNELAKTYLALPI